MITELSNTRLRHLMIAGVWLQIEEGHGPPLDLETEEGVRRALSWVRDRAKTKFAARLRSAVSNCAIANISWLPTDVAQLKRYLDSQTARRDIGLRELISPASV